MFALSSLSAGVLRRRPQALSRVGAALLLLAGLAGCATVPGGPADAVAAEDVHAPADDSAAAAGAAPLPGQELTPQIVYQLLLAEIAGPRGDLATAVSAYADLARTTRDPRIVRRAAEVALFSQRNDEVLEMARLWVELEPGALRARQMLIGALVTAERLQDVEPHVAALLKRAPSHAGELLLRLARAVAVSPKRKDLSAMLDRLAAAYPALPESHFVRAFAAQAAGDRERALKEDEEALRGRPGWEPAALFRAQLLQESGRMADAMASLRTFLDAYPNAREVRMQYARALTAEKHYAEARTQFLVLEKDAPDNPEVIHAVAVLSLEQGDLDGAESRFRTLIQAGRGNVNIFRMALGQLEEGRGREAEAMKWYEAVTAGEQFLQSRLRYAALLAKQKNLEGALAYLKGVPAKAEGERAQLLLGRSTLLRNAGRDKEAFEVLEQGLKAMPDQPELLYESGLLAEKVGRKELVEKRLRRLIKLKPDFAHAYNALGYSLAERGERLEEAQTLIGKALELAPGDPFIMDSAGWVSYRRGDLEAAREKLAAALGIRADPEIAAHLGEVLWKLGRREEAERTWKDASRLAPGNELLSATMKKFLAAENKQ